MGHTRGSQNHSFSGLLAGIRGAEEKNQEWKGFPAPLRETWESDGNQGWKDGVPGSQAPRESRKEEGNTGNKKPFREPVFGVSRKNREEEQKIRG